jgi:hypothetical protein
MPTPHIFIEAGLADGIEPPITAPDISLPRNDAFCAALGGVGSSVYKLTPICPDRGIARDFFVPRATLDEFYEHLHHWTRLTPDEWDEAVDRAGSAHHLGEPAAVSGGLGAHLAMGEWFRALEATGHKVRITVGFEMEAS